MSPVRATPPVTATDLGLVRAAVYASWLLEVMPDPLPFWGEVPRAMHRPVGVLGVVPDDAWDRVLDPTSLRRLQQGLVVLLAMSAVGARPYRPIAVATALLLTGHQAVLRGFTFVNHEELCPLISTYLLALFPAADGFSVAVGRGPAANPGTYAAAIDAMSLLTLLPYCQIGARRLVRGGRRLYVGESVPHWLGALDAIDEDARGIGPWLLARPRTLPLLKTGFAVTTVLELLAPLCLVSTRLRRVWAPAMIGMHGMNRLTLKLFFWQNSLLALVLLTGARRLALRWLRPGPSRPG